MASGQIFISQMCERMIEQSKPIHHMITDQLENHPARVRREAKLKDKIATIIEKHPNKSLSVLRRWLHNTSS